MTVTQNQQIGAMLRGLVHNRSSGVPGTNKLDGDRTETPLSLLSGLFKHCSASRIQFVRFSAQVQGDRNLDYVNGHYRCLHCLGHPKCEIHQRFQRLFIPKGNDNGMGSLWRARFHFSHSVADGNFTAAFIGVSKICCCNVPHDTLVEWASLNLWSAVQVLGGLLRPAVSPKARPHISFQHYRIVVFLVVRAIYQCDSTATGSL